MKSAILLLLISTCILVSGYRSFSGYQVWKTSPITNETNVDEFKNLLSKHNLLNLDIFFSLGKGTRVLAPPALTDMVRDELTRLGLNPELHIEDYEEYLKPERKQIDEWRDHHLNGNITFERYMLLDEIEAYLDSVVCRYPEVASLEVIGHSIEGRPLQVLKISSSNHTRAAVFMDAGIHAREWMAPPVALYVAHQLTAAENRETLLELADWYILPVANPDGYVYSWDEDRFWRKNTRTHNGTDCQGVDLNRNFNIEWNVSSDSNMCQGWYKGSSPHSEPETKAIAEYLIRLKGRLSLYMAIHSFSTLLLHPYGYENKSVSDAVIHAAEEADAIVSVRGTNYTTGSIAGLLYPAYGSSLDFAYDVAGAPFAYTFELPAGGDVGFNPPTSDILPVVQETWEGIKTLASIACNTTTTAETSLGNDVAT